jgi:hypothetical protein
MVSIAGNILTACVFVVVEIHHPYQKRDINISDLLIEHP